MDDPKCKKNKGPRFEATFGDGSRTTLQSEFVMANFPAKFIEKVVEEGEKMKSNFIFVPPGAPCTSAGHPLIREDYPPTHYLQNDRWTCLFSSFASALHFIGLWQQAAIFVFLSEKFSVDKGKGWDGWRALLHIMRSECKWLVPRKLTAHFDILNDRSIYPTVVQLQAGDGGTQHAITVVGQLIFDSNCVRALPLALETLHHCCSSDEKKGTFCRVFHAYRFEERETTKQKNWKN